MKLILCYGMDCSSSECKWNVFLRVITCGKCGTRDNNSSKYKFKYKRHLSWHTFVRFVTTALFLVSYVLWFIAWKRNKDTWSTNDKMFQDAVICYSVASVVSFLHVTSILRVHRKLGTLELSLRYMLKDMFYFAVLFFFLFISFATGIRKLYSYHASATKKDHILSE